nr:subfamily S1A unassigned peptidase (S01 family) [Hymenolepis microstoma]
MGTKELKPTVMDRFKGALTRLFNFFYGQRKLQTYYHVEKIILHPRYEEPNLEHDVALMKLKERIQLSRLKRLDVLRIPFPGIVGEDYPPTNMTCTAVGWGSACAGCMPEMNLRAVELPVVSHTDCQKIFVSPINLTESIEFCAGHVNGGKGIGPGDSGGPLVCDYDGFKMLGGVTSAIHAKYPESYPAVFTRVSAFADWIVSTMRVN